MQALLDNLAPLLQGLLTTLWMAALSAVGALVLGVVVTAMRVSPIPVLRGVAFAYVQLFLNVPLLALLVLFVFALPDAGLLMPLPMTAVVVLVIYEAAYVAEAVRSGVNTVALGQAEAARALGLTFRQTLGSVILPQALRAVVQPVGNVMIALVMNTSLFAAVGIVELTAAANKTNLVHAQPIPIFVGAGLTYMALALLIGLGTGWLERRVAIVR
jgi:glutamate transport system permease protein